MPIYCITGFSPVAGDAWYLEADSPQAASELLWTKLREVEFDDPLPVSEWQIVEVPRPFDLSDFQD